MKQQLRFFFVLLSFSLVLPFAAGALDDANGSYDFSDNNTVSGTLVDQAEQYNGSLNGVQTGVSGILNEAYSFDGNDDYVEFEDTDWSERDEFSVSIWAYFEDTSSNQYLYSPPYDGSSNHPWHLKFDTNQVTLEQVIFRNFDNQGGRGQLVETGFTPSKNEWHHIVAVNNGSEQKIYWNNSVVGTGSYSGYDSVNIDKYAIGAFWHEGEQNYDGSFDGRLDEARFYDRALSPSEVGTLYNQGEGFDPYAQPTNFTLAAEDAFDGSSLANFSISVRHLDAGSICPGGNCSLSAYNVSTYNTTNGLITTDLTEDNTDDIRRINFSAQAYEDRKYDDLSIDPSNQTSFTGFLRQAQSKFTTAQTLVTNKTLTSFNVTINGQTFQSNKTFPSPTRYNATFTKDGWFNKTQEYDVATLQQTFEDVYNHDLTFTAEEILSEASISNFTVELTHVNTNTTRTKNTTNGTIPFRAVRGETYEYRLTDGDGIATRLQNGDLIIKENITTPSNPTSNVLLETYTKNTLELNVFDVDSKELITQQVNATLSGGPEDRTVTSNNGTIFIEELLTGDYKATIETSGYEPQSFFFSVSEQSFQSIEQYIDTTTERTVFSVRDSLRDPIRNAVMTIRTKIDGESVLVSQKRTDFSGTTRFDLNTDKEYVFTVSKEGFETFEGTVTPALSSYTVTLSRESPDDGENVREDYELNANTTVSNDEETFKFFARFNSENNNIISQSYTFSYNDTTYTDTSSSSAGEFFETNPINIVDTQRKIDVEYTVETSKGTDTFTRTYSIRKRFSAFNSFQEASQDAGPATRGILSMGVTSTIVVSTVLATGSLVAASLFGSGVLGFFAYISFLPVTVTLISIASLIVISISLGRIVR